MWELWKCTTEFVCAVRREIVEFVLKGLGHMHITSGAAASTNRERGRETSDKFNSHTTIGFVDQTQYKSTTLHNITIRTLKLSPAHDSSTSSFYPVAVAPLWSKVQSYRRVVGGCGGIRVWKDSHWRSIKGLRRRETSSSSSSFIASGEGEGIFTWRAFIKLFSRSKGAPELNWSQRIWRKAASLWRRNR